MNLPERITVDPLQCGGRPCIRDMRIRVSDVLDLLGQGVSEAEILTDVPDLEREDIHAADHHKRSLQLSWVKAIWNTRAAAMGSWSYSSTLEKQDQAARERREAVSPHALSSLESSFAQLLAEVVVRQVDDKPSAIFNIALDL